MLDDGSPTSTNLGNNHAFINKEYSWYEASRVYAQSGQYVTLAIYN